jgi:hypothetical protein
MKKIYLLSVILLASMMAFGQSFIWESFDANTMPPAGWTLEGFTTQWSCAPSNNAGGSAPEAKYSWTNGNGTSRLISPAIDLTGLTTVKLSFRHYYDYYAAGITLGVATRSGGGSWHNVWTITPSGNVGPIQQNVDITNSDVGSSTFQFCIFIQGNMYNLDYWYIDNILLFNPLNLDGMMILNGTAKYFKSPTEVKGTLMNVGQTPIQSVDIAWKINGTVYPTSFTGLNIPTLGTYDFTHPDLLNVPIGVYNLNVFITNVNGGPDNDQDNDSLVKQVNSVCNTNDRKPCFEEFTSSTCPPCATFNTSFVPWCITHEDEITLIKYQMNWPAPGDPYYTAEGGVRKDYYGVGWVPWLVTNGSFTDTDMGAVNTAFTNAQMQPGLFGIASSHSLNGHVMTVDAAILPFANFTDLRIHIIVFEYITTGNVGSNGETWFHHVMMKMMPDAYGNTANMTDRTPVMFSETVDLTGTHVEEWDDLGVLVLVQDNPTQEIYQSAYSEEGATFNNDATLAGINVDGVPIAGFDPNVYSYTVVIPQGAIIVPEVTATPADPNATVIVVPTLVLPGTTIIDVFGEDLMTHLQYTVEFTFQGVGIEDPQPAVGIYPNPTTGIVYIQGASHADLSVHSSGGIEVLRIHDFTQTSVNLGDLSEGVYVMTIRKDENTVLRKKVVLVK